MFTYTSFDRQKMIAQGSIEAVALELKSYLKKNEDAQVLTFSDFSGRQIDLDLSGTDKDIKARLKIYSLQNETVKTKAGRPKLGVIPREISLLPQHWEWLTYQDGGASAAIRLLIDDKIKTVTQGKDKVKYAQEVTYKVLSSIAGDLPNYEEAIRFLYRKDKNQFNAQIVTWPKDIIEYAQQLSKNVFE